MKFACVTKTCIRAITRACFASVNCGPRTAVARVVGEYSGGQNSFPGLKSFPDTLSGNQPFSETSDAKPDQNSPLIINTDRSTTMTLADQLAEYRSITTQAKVYFSVYYCNL